MQCDYKCDLVPCMSAQSSNHQRIRIYIRDTTEFFRGFGIFTKNERMKDGISNLWRPWFALLRVLFILFFWMLRAFAYLCLSFRPSDCMCECVYSRELAALPFYTYSTSLQCGSECIFSLHHTTLWLYVCLYVWLSVVCCCCFFFVSFHSIPILLLTCFYFSLYWFFFLVSSLLLSYHDDACVVEIHIEYTYACVFLLDS